MSARSLAAFREAVVDGMGLPEHGSPAQRFDLLTGSPFAVGYERVVIGERGAYVEFTREQIVAPLVYRFGSAPHSALDVLPVAGSCDHYYVWLEPVPDRRVKVYWQVKPVAYADYKRGFYYVAPTMLHAVGCVGRGPRQQALFGGA